MAKRCSVDFVPGAAYDRMSHNAKQVLLCVLLGSLHLPDFQLR